MIRTVIRGAVLLAVAASLPAISHAAPQAKATRAILHVTQHYKGMMSFKHAMGSATLKYTKGDVTINLTTDNLPSPKTLGKRVYVLFATDGAMTDRVGALTTHGMMAGVKAMVMMNKIQDLYVYAENAPNVKHPKGILVMSAMVG